MQSIGIDYGHGKTNIDVKTGIRYGVIHQNKVLQVWCDTSEPFYGEHAFCPFCGTESEAEPFAVFTCKSCNKEVTDNDYDCIEPVSYVVEDKEYTAESDSYGDIFITRSPYYTLCGYCSPYAPGAGYITDTREEGIKAYCFGADYFDNDNCPYPIYDVETGKLLYTPKEKGNTND